MSERATAEQFKPNENTQFATIITNVHVSNDGDCPSKTVTK